MALFVSRFTGCARRLTRGPAVSRFTAAASVDPFHVLRSAAMSSIELPDEARAKLQRLAEMSVNLEISGTAVETVNEALRVHIADSLAGLEADEIRSAHNLIDIGTGVGFPALPLAIALPGTSITLVDSVRKKVETAARLARELELDNVESIWGRAEELTAVGGPYRERYDTVTARALAPLGVLVEYAGPFLREGGHLVAWKGALSSEELDDAAAAERALSMQRVRVDDVAPFRGSREHRLVVSRKTGQTPEQFPRRAGMALKKPLRSAPKS